MQSKSKDVCAGLEALLCAWCGNRDCQTGFDRLETAMQLLCEEWVPHRGDLVCVVLGTLMAPVQHPNDG